jgi:hypothetical protein
MSVNEVKAVNHWVKQSTRKNKLNKNKKTIEEYIQDILNSRKPLNHELIVYRGHNPDSKTIIPNSWFSTSDDLDKVYKHHISENSDCCLFKIHLLPGIVHFNVDEFIKKGGLSPTGHEEESEIIVNGKGIFYKNKELSEKGFTELNNKYKGVTIFETWYGLPKKVLTLKKLKNRISENNYEFINSIKDLRNQGIISKNEEISDEIFKELLKIMKLPNQNGGKKYNKTRKNKKLSS